MANLKNMLKEYQRIELFLTLGALATFVPTLDCLTLYLTKKDLLSYQIKQELNTKEKVKECLMDPRVKRNLYIM